MRLCYFFFSALLLPRLSQAAQSCDEYARRGYCEDETRSKYMARHCPDACQQGSKATSGVEEDEACSNWASEGYCNHDQFVDYMKRSCPTACGFATDDKPAENELAAEDEAGREDEHEDDEALDVRDADVEAAKGAPEDPPTSRAASSAGGGSGGGVADQSEHCGGWARQGLCDAGSSHAEYMSQNCAATCASHAAGGGAAAAGGGGGEGYGTATRQGSHNIPSRIWRSSHTNPWRGCTISL